MQPWEATLSNLLFTVLVLVTVLPAFLVVLTTDIVRAACWLLFSLSGAAGLFFFLGADFVGATQLLIYVGGTLVLVIFGVMLTAAGPFVKLNPPSGDYFVSVAAGFVLAGVLIYGLTRPTWNDPTRFPPQESSSALREATTNRVGMALLGFPAANPSPAQTAAAPVGGVRPPVPEASKSGYLLPFEIISVHLVVVLIGAAYLARAKRRRVEEKEL